MRRSFFVLSLLGCLTGMLPGQQQGDHGRRKIAIIALPSTIQEVQTYGGAERFAEAMHDEMTRQLSSVPGVVLVERQMLRQVMRELGLVASEAFDDRDAVRLGKLLQADALLITRVGGLNVAQQVLDENGFTIKDIPYGGGKLIGKGADLACKLFRCPDRTVTEREQLTLSVTGRLIAVENGTVQGIGGQGNEVRDHKVKYIRGGGREEKKSIDRFAFPQEALAGAVKKASSNFGPALAAIPAASDRQVAETTTLAPGQMMVAKVAGNTLYLVKAQAAGVRAGNKLQIQRQGEPIIDPLTGKTVGHVLSTVETATVANVNGDMAEAQVDGAASQAKVRDIASKVAPTVATAAPEQTPLTAPKPVRPRTPAAPTAQPAPAAKSVPVRVAKN